MKTSWLLRWRSLRLPATGKEELAQEFPAWAGLFDLEGCFRTRPTSTAWTDSSLR